MANRSLDIARKFLHRKVKVVIDRPLGSRHPTRGFEYPVNYGFVEGVKAPDGEDLDAYYLGVNRPLEEGAGICIAIVHRRDDDDDKLVVVPEGLELSDEEIMQRIRFQEQWFHSEILRA